MLCVLVMLQRLQRAAHVNVGLGSLPVERRAKKRGVGLRFFGILWGGLAGLAEALFRIV
jgi:hypothetical protein